MPVLALVGAVVVIDVAAKLFDAPTISAVLRRNKAEALIGIAWLTVHVMKEEQ